MAVLGYLICRTCKERTCVGKWLRRDTAGFGFWRGSVSYEDLGLKTLNFLARHTNHDILMVSDHEFEKLFSYREYKDVEEDLRSDWPADANPPETSG